MLSLLRNRSFALLWVGGLISRVGDWVLFVALPFYVYARTGSALATSGMFMAETIPTLLFGTLAGVYVDRWDRKRTMIAADLCRAAAVLGLLALGLSAELHLWLIYAVSFLLSLAGQFFGPAQSALLPHIVTEKQLLSANSLFSASGEITRLVAAPAGGALVAAFGLGSVVWLDSLSFVGSAICIALIAVSQLPIDEVNPATLGDAAASANGPASSTSALARVWTELWDGLRVVRRSQLLLGLFIVVSAASLGQGIINTMIVPFVKGVLGGDAEYWGFFIASQGIGGLLGAALCGKLGEWLPPRRLLGVSGVLCGAVVIAVPWFASAGTAIVLVALVGLPAVIFFVTIQTLLQRGVSDQFRGRVFGAYGTVNTLILLIGMAVAGPSGDGFGVVPVLEAAGALYLASGLLAALLVPQTGSIASETIEPVVELV